MTMMSYIQAVTRALREEMQRDEKVFILGEDVGQEVEYSELPKDSMRSSVKRGFLTRLLQNQLLPVWGLEQRCMA